MKRIVISILACVILIMSWCLVACDSKVEFKVNFVVDGEIYSTINTSGREVISIPENPTKDGYEFDGWYWDDGKWQRPFTANSLLDEPLSSDMSVYAKWKETQSESTLELSSVDISSAVLTVSGEIVTATLSNVTQTFSFLNDITVADGATYILSNDIECQNVIASKTVALNEGDNTYYLLVTNGNAQKFYTITIRRRPIYTVEFNVNGGTTIETLHIEEDSNVEMQETSKKGYTFDGWALNGENAVFPYVVKGDTTFNAKYTAISYKIEYNLNNGTNNAENISNYTIEQTVLLKKPTKDCYRFDGWYETSDFSGTPISKFTQGTTENKTLYAKWTPIQYPIEYELNKGANNENNVSTYNVEQEITLKNPTRDGYAFLGWFTESTFDNKVDKIILGSNGNKKFYAKWQACENKLVFDGNGATSGSMVDMVIDTDEIATLLNNAFVKAGYTFKGWSTTVNGNVEYLDGASYTMGTNSTYTLYAIWEANNNTLIFNANNGIGTMQNMTIATDSSETLLSNVFTREGYKFKGWSTISNGEVEYTDGAIYKMGFDTENNLYAVWEIEIYEIKYNITNHSNPTTYTILDLPLNLDNPIINENEKFIGWYSTSDFDDSDITQITEIGGAEIYAALLSSEGLEFVDEGETVTVKSYSGTNELEETGDGSVSPRQILKLLNFKIQKLLKC